MKIERKFDNGIKQVKTLISTSTLTTKKWESITDVERAEILEMLDNAESDIVQVRQKIKSIPVIKTKALKPGLTPEQVEAEVSLWLTERKHTDPSWGYNSLYINGVTGAVAYTKDLPDPADDGYVKGFQIAFDIHTNQMIARNCDNIWKSMGKRGFVRIESLEQFKKFYRRP